MSKETEISWADSTASPWFGCTEVSPGCINCYARDLTLRKGWAGWGDKAPRVRSKGFWKDIPRWNRKAGNPGAHRLRIFPSLMDWLDPKVPNQWLWDFFSVIHASRNLDFLLLTKRPELFWSRMDDICSDSRTECPSETETWVQCWRDGSLMAHNVWIGVTVEDQTRADERIPQLLEIPAKVRFLSVEPLLQRVNLHFSRPPMAGGQIMPGPLGIHWVIVGGESGPKRRDCGVDAIRDIAEQCHLAGIPCWVKQDCAMRPGQQGRLPDEIWNIKQLPNI